MPRTAKTLRTETDTRTVTAQPPARWAVLIGLLVGLPVVAPAMAQADANVAKQNGVEEKDVRLVLDSLEGSWDGELFYRDYGSDQRVSIPMRVTQKSIEGDLAAVRFLEFVDPGRVIRNAELLRFTAGDKPGLTTAPMDAGETGGEAERWSVQSLRVEGPASWQAVFVGSGTDNGRPVLKRLSQSLDGNTMRQTNEIDYTDDEGDTGEAGTNYEYRNSARVTRTQPDAGVLGGAWTVDLRPTPDAAPYPVKMVIENIANGAFTGSFYNGSAIDNARLNTQWGSVYFAFTTKDGGSTYHTQGRLRADGRLEGTTHAVGRDFLAAWTAEPANNTLSTQEN